MISFVISIVSSMMSMIFANSQIQVDASKNTIKDSVFKTISIIKQVAIWIR